MPFNAGVWRMPATNVIKAMISLSTAKALIKPDGALVLIKCPQAKAGCHVLYEPFNRLAQKEFSKPSPAQTGPHMQIIQVAVKAGLLAPIDRCKADQCSPLFCKQDHVLRAQRGQCASPRPRTLTCSPSTPIQVLRPRSDSTNHCVAAGLS